MSPKSNNHVFFVKFSPYLYHRWIINKNINTNKSNDDLTKFSDLTKNCIQWQWWLLWVKFVVRKHIERLTLKRRLFLLPRYEFPLLFSCYSTNYQKSMSRNTSWGLDKIFIINSMKVLIENYTYVHYLFQYVSKKSSK